MEEKVLRLDERTALVVVIGYNQLLDFVAVETESWSVAVIRRLGKCPNFLVGGTLLSLHGGWSSGNCVRQVPCY